ncbi:MAG: Gfo/Idh/MocA family oxidoreductase [bacterium]|nr:Gfo/Idh/MocA family oxidoreductase [bacterium]
MLKIGILGAGAMGEEHSKCYSSINKGTAITPLLHSKIQLYGICDYRKEAATKLANKFKIKKVYTDPHKLIDEVDMIDICLPTKLHPKFTIEAAQKGKHILCEKPIALTLKEAEGMIQTAKKAKVKFMVAQVVRFWPEYITLKDIIDSGELGELIFITMNRDIALPVWSDKNWLLDNSQSGGVVTDLHIHDIDFTNFLIGKPVSVYSTGIRLDCRQACNNKGLYTQVSTTLKYPGKIAYVESNFLMPKGYELGNYVKAVCKNGFIEINNKAKHTLTVQKPGKKFTYPKLPKKDGYIAEIEYFINCILKNKEPKIVTPEDAKFALELVLKAKESLDTGRCLKLKS